MHHPRPGARGFGTSTSELNGTPSHTCARLSHLSHSYSSSSSTSVVRRLFLSRQPLENHSFSLGTSGASPVSPHHVPSTGSHTTVRAEPPTRRGRGVYTGNRLSGVRSTNKSNTPRFVRAHERARRATVLQFMNLLWAPGIPKPFAY